MLEFLNDQQQYPEMEQHNQYSYQHIKHKINFLCILCMNLMNFFLIAFL